MLPVIPPELAARLHQRARAWRWEVSTDVFAMALERSAAKAGARDAEALERHLDLLHLEDLALACACEQGQEAAWEHFVREYRPVLARAATAIAGDAGLELADSLHADLFGLKTRDGERQSLFRYFHGRSSLATWLRAVLAQRYVDSIRSARRIEPLPEDDARDTPVAPAATANPDTAAHIARVQSALAAAIARLDPRDRLRLGWYYAHDMTLAQIGRALKEHEATVSRHLSRTRKALRDDVERQLAEAGWPEAAIAEALTAAAENAAGADLGQLLGPNGARKNAGQDRSTGEGHP